MKPTKGYYSIIQYCPDLGRVEAANVGVLLYCPERGFLRAITSANNSRIIHFFGSEGHDWKRINALKKGLEQRLTKESGEIKNVDDLRQFIAMRANQLQITPPNPMKVHDPEKDLRELYEQILGEPVRRGRAKSLRRYVRERLAQPDLENKIAEDITVTVPVLQKTVEIPFGFQNGRFNLINPVRFGSQNPDQSVATACKYAVEGKSLYQHPDATRGELQLVIVGQFRGKDTETPARVRRVLSEHDVKLFKTDELPQLIDEIRRTGKVLEHIPPKTTDG